MTRVAGRGGAAQHTIRLGVGVAIAAALIGLVILAARTTAEPPARCAPGMIALGARCCGEGQQLTDGRCLGAPSHCAPGMTLRPEGCAVVSRRVALAAGTLRVGPGDWEAQGVVAPYQAVIDAFVIDAFEVTEERYAECLAAGACAPITAELGGSSESRIPREPGRAVAGVTLAEAARFCVWAGGALPSSAELAFAAAGAGGRRYPWGDTGAVCRRAAWGLAAGPCGEGASGPELAGSHPDGATPEGVHDLAGNVAEWTSPEDPRAQVADVRGGSWSDSAAAGLRSWHRREVSVATRSPEIGFRCVYRPTRG